MIVKGDILVSSWGYDQTNVDFYQVLKTSKDYATLVRLQSKVIQTGFMSGTSCPTEQIDTEPPFRRKIHLDHIKINSYAYARVWDGKPARCSWYA